MSPAKRFLCLCPCYQRVESADQGFQLDSKEVECGQVDIGLEEVTADSAGLGNSVTVDNLLASANQDSLA